MNFRGVEFVTFKRSLASCLPISLVSFFLYAKLSFNQLLLYLCLLFSAAVVAQSTFL